MRRDLLTGAPIDGGNDRHERADAARNRARVLLAADRLFAERGARNVTMDDIARAACVGRGTLYRRFPDPPSIAASLIDENERAHQEQMIRGEPPLGPGAPPLERLCAFYRSTVELMEQELYLMLALERTEFRAGLGPYGFWRAHVRSLLLAAGTPDPDALVDLLLAPLAAEVYHHQRYRLGISSERIIAALERLARAALRAQPGGD